MAIVLDLKQARLQRYMPSGVAAKLHAPQALAGPDVSQRLDDTVRLLDYKARIDNRAELAHKLGIVAAGSHDSDVAALLLLAYRRWGGEMCRHLRGDWWFAIWDGAQRHLLLAVDPSSARTVFYARTEDGGFACSPSLLDLLQVPGVSRELCEARILSYLTRWVRYPDYTQTEYRAVRQLLSASCLIVDEQKETLSTYWRVADLKPLHLDSDEDYAAQFLAHFRRAVVARIDGAGQVGSMLSAGLDSSSVTALLAQELARQKRGFPALTHVPLAVVQNQQLAGRLLNEWPLAQCTAQQYGNIEHIAVHSADVSPLWAYRKALDITGRMQATNLNAPWQHQLHSIARQHGVDTLFGGQLGNLVVSWNGEPGNFWRELANGQWSAARAQVFFNGEQQFSKLGSSLARQLWHCMKPRAAGFRFAELPANPAHPNLIEKWRSEFTAHELVGEDGADQTAYRNAMLPMAVTTTTFGSLLASGYGLDIADPTADQDLIEFCLRSPNRQFAFQGHLRWLIRRAMTGILPSAVQWNRARGVQPADCVYRFLAIRDEVEALLEQMKKSNLAQYYLDVDDLQKRWQKITPSITFSEDFSVVQSGLGAGLFLAHAEGLPVPFACDAG